MNRNIFSTLNEAIEELDGNSFDGSQDVVLLPPSNDPYASDEEAGDDDIGMGGNIDLPADVAGTIELHNHYGDEEDHDDDNDSDGDIFANSSRGGGQKGNRRNWRNGVSAFEDDWIGQKEKPNVATDLAQLGDMNELELYKLFFDNDIEQLFVDCTKRYAVQKNDPNFSIDIPDLWDFLTIITLSSYNTRPQFSMFWSTEEDISCPLVKELMSRNYFRKIKAYLHVCDNNDISGDDKWAKLRPLFDLVNEKLVQFGVFAEHLSIDEQMVPYFGRHSCKMFIRGKPIRFGYKNWVLCSDDGFPFKVIPYQGKSGNKQPLGPRVVKDLLEVIDDNRQHDVYFDNFFTSVPLLEDLKHQGLPATGTIRVNRLPGLPLPSIKTMEKDERGKMKVCSTLDVSVVRWVDNKVVTVASNHLTHEPLSTCKRYSKVKRARLDFSQPLMIRKYNAHMGGVDQLDAYLNNLRPCIGGKKWYWMQLINLVRLLQVAAFRLFNNLHPDKKVSQLSYLRALVHQYIRFDRKNERFVNTSMPRLVSRNTNGHFLESSSQGRCKYCMKNCRMVCSACNVRLHNKCFPLYHTQ